MRRAFIGAVAGVVLALATATGVSAYWHAQHTVSVSATSSGDLSLDVTWADGSAWGPIGPGGTIAKRATVVVGGAGTTLQARVTGEASNAPAFDPYVTRTISVDDCTGAPGPALPATGYPAEGSLVPGDAVTVCVRYTLSPTAPAALQGQDLAPHVVFNVAQRSRP